MNKIVNEAGPLLRAHEKRFADSSDLVFGVTLTFERLTAHIAVVADDDTIIVSLDSCAEDSDSIITESEQLSPLGRVYGFECQWAWLLTNQQGYTDGVRFEFYNDSRRRVVEMIVAASMIQYYEFASGG